MIPGGKQKHISFLIVVCCLFFAVSSCDYWMAPFSTFVEKATGMAYGLDVLILTDHYPNDIRAIPPDSVISIPVNEITEILVSIRNQQEYDLELAFTGEGESITSAVMSDDKQSAVVTITNPERLEIINLTMTISANGRPMPDCKLPVMQGRYFNNDLVSLSVISDYEDTNGFFNKQFSPDSTEYTVYVPFETESVNIAASVPDNVYSSFTIDGKEATEGSSLITMPTSELTVPVSVTADCGDTKTYILNIIKGLSPYAYITEFYIDVNGVKFEGMINEDEKTINITLPYDTDITNITPLIEYSGADISPVTPQNFSTPITYTLTAPFGNTITYTVTVNLALITGMEITALPSKTDFFIGDAEPDFTELGLTVTVYFNNGMSSVITGYNLSGFDTSTAGVKKITITFDGITASFDINVIELDLPSAGITLIFNQIDIPIVASGVTIYRTGTTGRSAVISITNAGSFDSFEWFYEGVSIGTGSSITLTTDAEPLPAYSATMGIKVLTVIASTADGVQYSAKVQFTVALQP